MITLIYMAIIALTYALIGEDKAMHILASTTLVCIGCRFLNAQVFKVMGVVLLIGFLKEVFDYNDYGLFSFEDMIANAFGVLSAIFFYKLQFIKNWWDYIILGHIKK